MTSIVKKKRGRPRKADSEKSSREKKSTPARSLLEAKIMNSGRIYYAGQKQPTAEITNGALVWLREPEDEVEDTAVRRAFAMWQIGKMKDRKPKKYTPPPGDPEDAASPPPAPKMTASDGVKTPEYKLWVKKYHPEMYFDLYRERP